MKIIADTHTHTIASTHAYSTVQEMVKQAQEIGLYAIAITDHAYNMPGSPGMWYFDNLSAIPEYLYGVRILKGIEANIIDYKGNIDVPLHIQKSLDWVVASVHGLLVEEKEDPTIEKCTQLYLNVCKNPYVNVIGHSGSGEYKYDYEKVIPEFGKNGKLVEINNASFRCRKDSVKNCMEIANVCKKHNVPIIINSDAHFSTAVGAVDEAINALKEIDFPEHLIVNTNVERFKEYVAKYVDTKIK